MSDRDCVTLEVHDGRALVSVTGPLDATTAHHLRTAMIEVVGDGIQHLTVGLARVTSVDPHGIEILRTFANTHPAIALSIAQPPAPVRTLCRAAGIDRLVVGASQSVLGSRWLGDAGT